MISNLSRISKLILCSTMTIDLEELVLSMDFLTNVHALCLLSNMRKFLLCSGTRDLREGK